VKKCKQRLTYGTHDEKKERERKTKEKDEEKKR
jgi:hypothetical protein